MWQTLIQQHPGHAVEFGQIQCCSAEEQIAKSILIAKTAGLGNWAGH